jgi:predicted secreted protein
MALISLQNAMILLGGTDISDHTSSVELDIEGEDLDATTFATAGWKSTLGGLKSGTLNITVKGDYAASNIDSILWGYFNTVQTFEVRPVNTARSTSNPAYTGSVLVNSLTPVTGEVGDLVEFDLSWPTSGVVQRQTS